MSIPLKNSRDIHTANVVYVQLGHLTQPVTVLRMLHTLDCIYYEQALFLSSFCGTLFHHRHHPSLSSPPLLAQQEYLYCQ